MRALRESLAVLVRWAGAAALWPVLALLVLWWLTVAAALLAVRQAAELVGEPLSRWLARQALARAPTRSRPGAER